MNKWPNPKHQIPKHQDFWDLGFVIWDFFCCQLSLRHQNRNMSRKILIVSPTPTHPNRAGNSSRIFYLCEALRKLEHEVHFVHIERDKSNRMQMKKYWGDRYTHLAYRSSFNFCVRYACKKWLMLLSPWHRYMQWNIDDWYSNHITKQILTLNKKCSFDTVIV